MRIDVYDFDGTIYDGDSTVDFTRFCLRRHPAVLAGLPRFIGTSVLLIVVAVGAIVYGSTRYIR